MRSRSGSSHRVILHADDFGMSPSVNSGIVQSFREGLLTSTSLLANAPAAEEALSFWPKLIDDLQNQRLPSQSSRQELQDVAIPFDLGIHLNLTQGRPLTGENYPATLLSPEKTFPGIGPVFRGLRKAKNEEMRRVREELAAQIEWMQSRGFHPTHLNGHQYIELIPQVAGLIPTLLQQYSIATVRVAVEKHLSKTVLYQGRISAWALAIVKRHFARRFRRQMRRSAITFPDQFYGTAHAGIITLKEMSNFLKYSTKVHWTEIGLHPGAPADPNSCHANDPWFDPLQMSRSAERDWLCSAAIRDLFARQKLKLGRLQAVRKRIR